MAQHRPPDTFDDLPLIETPVIDFQYLKHKGVKIEPTLNVDDKLDFAREDEAVLEALEEFEKSIREQPQG